MYPSSPPYQGQKGLEKTLDTYQSKCGTRIIYITNFANWYFPTISFPLYICFLSYSHWKPKTDFFFGSVISLQMLYVIVEDSIQT